VNALIVNALIVNASIVNALMAGILFLPVGAIPRARVWQSGAGRKVLSENPKAGRSKLGRPPDQ
jgi:hypothetical protein